MSRVRSSLRIAGIGAITLLPLAGCIDDAGTGASTAPTLSPLTQNTFVTLPPETTTTVPAPITAAPSAGVAAAPGVTTAPGETTTSAAETADQSAETDPQEPEPQAGGQSYTVVAQDTVFGIARTHGLSAEALADFNNWSDGIGHAIFPGDKIQIPAGATTTATTARAGSASTTTTAATGTTIASSGTYTVVAGDYLAGIAAKTGTTVQGIVDANGWSDGADHLIIPGQVIKLPAKSG